MMTLMALLSAALLQADLAEKLRELDPKVLPAEQPRMIGQDARSRIQAANRRSSEAWAEIDSRAKWEAFAQAKVRDLRASLNLPPDGPRSLTVKTTKTLDGDGFRIENVVFETRPD